MIVSQRIKENIQLLSTKARFEEWRGREPRGRRRIAEALWQEAVELARENGVCATASALGLSFKSLKERVNGGRRGESSEMATFIELPREVLFQAGGSLVEIEGPTGLKLRFELRGEVDVAALALRLFAGGAS